MGLEFLNPNLWAIPSPHEFRIYGDDNAQTWGVVSEVDYHFLIRWKWSWTTPLKGYRENSKRYLRRNFEEQIEPEKFSAGGLWENPETGNIVRARKPRIQKTLRMHTVIMLRTGITPPGPEFHLVDHLDGDETNYQRNNLRWATASMNRINLYGIHAKFMEENYNGEEALVREAERMQLQ